MLEGGYLIMNETMQTILHRRAIRRFDERQIDEELLQQILQAGLYAPSAGGKQGVIFAVCQDKEVNERLGKIKRANSNPHMATAKNYVSKEQPSIADDPKLINAFYDAPTVITMFAPKNFLFSVDDCAVAAENMMLAADSLGIGSCYIGQGWTAFADSYGQEVLRKWEIRTDYYAVMQLLLGYPKADDKHPAAKARKNDKILRF
jgi:nitroreductase